MAQEAKKKKKKTIQVIFVSIFVKKTVEFRTYFFYFHTFSYEFKAQRTATEFGPPLVYNYWNSCLISRAGLTM